MLRIDIPDSPAGRFAYLAGKYRRHPIMLILTFLTLVITLLLFVYISRNVPAEHMTSVIFKDIAFLLWIILFFFYSDKIIFIFLSHAKYERLKSSLGYILNENHFFIWGIFILILISIGLIVVEIVFHLSEQVREILRIADIVILSIFLLEFYLRFIAAGEDKIRHFMRAETIIDLIALFPLLRIFRLMRIIRLLRFLRVARLKRYLQSLSDSVAVFAALWSENVFNIVIIFLFAMIFIVFGALTIFHIESQHSSMICDFFDAVWWSVSLLFASQPLDDISHPGSRIIGMILIVGGVVISSILTGTIAAALSEKLHSVKTGSTYFHFRDHIVICGWRKEGAEMIEYLHQHMGRRKKHIVVIDDSIDELPPLGKDVYFIKGNPASESVLVRANAHYASAAIILSGEGEGLYSDQKTILATLAVESLSRKRSKRDIHTCAELIHLVNAKNLARAYVNEMVLVNEYSDDIIAQSALIPGFIDFMNELLTNERNDNNIYKIIPDAFVGKSFRDVYFELFDKNIIPIGVLREEEPQDPDKTQPLDSMGIPEKKYVTFINPHSEEFKITPKDKIFVISRLEDIKGWEVARE